MEFSSYHTTFAPHAQSIVASLSPKQFFIRPQVIAAVDDILQNPSKWMDPAYEAIAKDIMEMMVLIKQENISVLTLDRIEQAYHCQDARLKRKEREAIEFQRELMKVNYGDHWTRSS
jgi:hypothetical protein